LLSALGFKVYLITQSFQPTDQIAFQSFRLQALEIIRTQFLIGRITGQDVVNRDQDFVRHGDHGAFMPSSRFEAIIFLAKVTIFRAGGGDGRLDQSRAQVGVAGSNIALTSFPCALVLTGAADQPKKSGDRLSAIGSYGCRSRQ
jgi:hypothetical protein